MDPRLQAGLELQLDKQAQQEHDFSLSGVLGQYFKQAGHEKTAAPRYPNRKPGTGIGAAPKPPVTMFPAPTGKERVAARKKYLDSNRRPLATTKEFPGVGFNAGNAMSAANFKYLRAKHVRGEGANQSLEARTTAAARPVDPSIEYMRIATAKRKAAKERASYRAYRQEYDPEHSYLADPVTQGEK
jgi:hypothetical protein